MTVKLYNEDSYISSFTATVISAESGERGYEVILDRTAFFPEEGGQSADTGVLVPENGDETVRISGAKLTSGDIIHYADGPVRPGTTVRGQVDWVRRYDLMRQHTGEHIFSGLVHSVLGYDNMGFHLSDHIVTMDYTGRMSAEEVRLIEEKANAVIRDNVPVTVSYPDDEALESLVYRSKKEIVDEALRIVTIEGVDVCACCAPHVRATAEVGLLKVISVQNHKGGVRLTICCGERAYRLFSKEHDILTGVANSLSTSIENIPDRYAGMAEEITDLKIRLSEACGRIMEGIIKDVPDGDTHVVLEAPEGTGSNVIRESVNKLTEKHIGYCAVLTAAGEDKVRYCIGSSQSDCKALLDAMKDGLMAKGGGSERMIQGEFPAVRDGIGQADRMLRECCERI